MPLLKTACLRLGVFAAITASLAAQGRPADWPQWRGPNRDGAIASFVEPKSWPERLTRKNSGQFFGLDAKTGKTVWTSEPRQATNAAIVRAGDLLFVLKDDAELLVTRSGPYGFETARTYTVADSATWAEPVVSGNRVFVKDVATLALWTVN